MATDELEVNTPQHAAQALATPPSEDRAEPAPRLADGIELIGEFDGSGFKQAPYIARRQDGQVVQMPQLLYRLAEHVDGRAGVDEIAERFGAAIKRSVQADDARMLIEERLKPLGIVATGPHEDSAELGKVDPLLALKFRAAVVPDTAVRSLTTAFRPLFASPAVVGVVLALIGLDGWLFFVHGISQGLRHVLYQPALMLMLIAGVVLATAFHEIGHATACRYGGAKPGVMGVGVYIVWPAFYTDITDAYRLGKAGRLRTDLGGMYFNAIFALLVAAAYAATSFEPLLLLIVLQNFAIIQQALPLLRLDGYYILSDLTGVPDIFLRIRPVLSSLLPWRQADERVGELKSWVRVVVTLYVLLMVAFLAVGALAMVINLPRVTATGYDSAALHLQAIGPDFDHGQGLKGVLDVVETLFLILPAAGLLYTAVRLARRVGAGAKSWSSGSPVRQAALATAATAGIAVAVLSWWPNGEYRPIQPGERGTLSGFIGQVAALPSARPSLTAGRQRQLGGAPSERQLQSQQADHHVAGKGASRSQPPQSTTTSTTSSTATTTPTASSTTSTPTTTPTTTTTSTATTTVSTTPSSSSTATPAGGSSTTDSGSSAAPATTATTP